MVRVPRAPKVQTGHLKVGEVPRKNRPGLTTAPVYGTGVGNSAIAACSAGVSWPFGKPSTKLSKPKASEDAADPAWAGSTAQERTRKGPGGVHKRHDKAEDKQKEP